MQKRKVSELRLSVWIWGIFAVIGMIAAVHGQWFFLNLLLTALFTVLMIIPHELGHAIATRWLGGKVFRITIGSGRLAWRGTVFGFPCEIRQFPFHGSTLSLTRDRSLYRLRRFLIVISGPAVNLGFLYLILQISDPSLSPSLAPAWCLAAANAWILVANLFPYKLKLPTGKIPNDGLSLIMMPFLSEAKVEQMLRLYYVYEGVEALSNSQLYHAKAIFREGLEKYPENSFLRNGLGIACLELGQFREARSIFTSLLNRNEASKLLHAVLLNNLAYADILCDRHGLLEEADNLSLQVYRNFPWVPAFKRTRGIILVELSRIDEGIALLRQAMEGNEEPRSIAVDAAYLAIAEARKGSVERAKQYLIAARQLDSRCPVLPLAQSELSEALGRFAHETVSVPM